MRMPLRLKMALSYIAIAVAGFCFVYFFSARFVARQAQDTVLSTLYKDAAYLGAAYQVNTGSVNQGQIEAMAYASGSDIWLLDLSGNVVASSGTSDTPEAVPAFNPTEGTASYYMVGDFYGCFEEEHLSVYYPLTQGVTTNGYVVLHYPTDTIRIDADNRLLAAYIIYCAMLVLLLFFFIYLDITGVRRLSKIRKAGHEYVNGNNP